MLHVCYGGCGRPRRRARRRGAPSSPSQRGPPPRGASGAPAGAPPKSGGDDGDAPPRDAPLRAKVVWLQRLIALGSSAVAELAPNDLWSACVNAHPPQPFTMRIDTALPETLNATESLRKHVDSNT
eukprot:gene17990-biopygen5160